MRDERKDLVKSIAIPAMYEWQKVISIRDGAFYNHANLTSVIISDSLKEIGITAFKSCTSLASIYIPGSVTKIGESLFSECTSLESISISSSVIDVSYRTFMVCSKLTIFAEAESKQEGWNYY